MDVLVHMAASWGVCGTCAGGSGTWIRFGNLHHKIQCGVFQDALPCWYPGYLSYPASESFPRLWCLAMKQCCRACIRHLGPNYTRWCISGGGGGAAAAAGGAGAAGVGSGGGG